MHTLRTVALALLACVSLAGCISAKPVETQSAVDDRPLLFFTGASGSDATGLKIYVDGLYMAEAHEFVGNKKGLAVLPGTHLIEVRGQGETILREKIYVGSGTSKTIPLGR